jgi:hypothetical protein
MGVNLYEHVHIDAPKYQKKKKETRGVLSYRGWGACAGGARVDGRA